MNRDIYLCRLLSRLYSFRSSEVYAPLLLSKIPDFDDQLGQLLVLLTSEFQKNGILLIQEEMRSTFSDGIKIKKVLYFSFDSLSFETPPEVLPNAIDIARKYALEVNGLFDIPIINFAYLPREILDFRISGGMCAITEGLTSKDLSRILFDFIAAKERGKSLFSNIIVHEYLHAIGYGEEEVLQILVKLTTEDWLSFRPITDIVFDNLDSTIKAFSRAVRDTEKNSSSCLNTLNEIVASIASWGFSSLIITNHNIGVY